MKFLFEILFELMSYVLFFLIGFGIAHFIFKVFIEKPLW